MLLEARARIAGRMDIDDGVVLGRLLPERPQEPVADLQIARFSRDVDTLELELAHATLDLARRELGRMQRHAAEPEQPLQATADDFGEPIVEHSLPSPG